MIICELEGVLLVMSKLVKYGEEWVHTETAEIYTKDQLNKLNNKKMFEEHNKYLKNAIEHELDPKYKLVKMSDKESTVMTVKEGYKFNMMHRTDLKELMMNVKFTVQESAFIARLTPFISYPFNDVQIQNEYLTLEELSEFCGYHRTTMSKVIKRLEELEVIKVVKGGNRPPIVYFNPFLYAAGRDVHKDTFDMFCRSRYNPNIANYQ